jgi:iron complex transport system ATP-binding protein
MTALLCACEVALGNRLRPASLELQAGSMTAVIGPNGTGKTSLLRALAGVERSSGSVTVEGYDLHRASPSRRRRLGSFLPASREVVWPIAVEDVVALGLAAPDPARVSQLLRELDLDDLRHRAVDRLSTGERARALLARALAARPRVLLLDEPLSNLDPYHVLNTLRVLRQAADDGAAVLVAVHDLSTLNAFDRVLLLSRGQLVMDGRGKEILGSRQFARAFRVAPTDTGWRISD